MLLYHHCIDLKHLVYDEIKRSSEQVRDPDYFQPSNLWLEKEVGYFPIFLAVGDDVHMTGYQGNWSRSEFLRGQNLVMLSFSDVEGVFMDFDMWGSQVINRLAVGEEVSAYGRRRIFKYSWSKSDWLKRSKEEPGIVQLVTPKLDLRQAGRIWVRNKPTKKVVDAMGFKNVKVKRIFIGR